MAKKKSPFRNDGVTHHWPETKTGTSPEMYLAGSEPTDADTAPADAPINGLSDLFAKELLAEEGAARDGLFGSVDQLADEIPEETPNKLHASMSAVDGSTDDGLRVDADQPDAVPTTEPDDPTWAEFRDDVDDEHAHDDAPQSGPDDPELSRPPVETTAVVGVVSMESVSEPERAKELDSAIDATIDDLNNLAANTGATCFKLSQQLQTMKNTQGWQQLDPPFETWNDYYKSKMKYGRTYKSYVAKLLKADLNQLGAYLDQGFTPSTLVELAKASDFPEKLPELAEAIKAEVADKPVREAREAIQAHVEANRAEFKRPRSTPMGRPKDDLERRARKFLDTLSEEDLQGVEEVFQILLREKGLGRLVDAPAAEPPEMSASFSPSDRGPSDRDTGPEALAAS